jgi:hypothetical protein
MKPPKALPIGDCQLPIGSLPPDKMIKRIGPGEVSLSIADWRFTIANLVRKSKELNRQSAIGNRQ